MATLVRVTPHMVFLGSISFSFAFINLMSFQHPFVDCIGINIGLNVNRW